VNAYLIITHLQACFDRMNGCMLFKSEMTLLSCFSLHENEGAIVLMQ